MKLLNWLFLPGLILAGPVCARTAIYAHRASVEKAVMDQEEGACLADANRAKKDANLTFPYTKGILPQGKPMGAGLAGGLATGASSIVAGYKRYSLTIYDCMISKGYTMREVSPEDWKVAKKLAAKEREEQMFKWRSTLEPVHPEVGRDRFD